MYKYICDGAENLQEQMTLCRRNLHKYAEKGWLEIRTSSFIARKLTELGYEVLTGKEVCKKEERMGLPSAGQMEEHYHWAVANGADPEFAEKARDGFTGVIGILDCGPGPVIAMRFDIDALGVTEENSEEHRPFKEGFASITPGTMHACGHDAHTAIGLGVAQILVSMREYLSGKVKLIFQPAEEGVRGAKPIVKNGHLDDVDYVLGAHLLDSKDENYYVSPGIGGSFATSKLDILFKGQASHAAVAHLGKNAMLAAATAVLGLYGIPRHGQGETAVNVGTLHAGTGRNVICDEAKLEFEVRGKTTEINQYMEKYAINIIETAAKMHFCDFSIKRMGSAASIQCTPGLTELIEKVCRDRLGINVQKPEKMAASEDYSYMTQRVINQGGEAVFVGINIPCAAAFHNNRFDFDEKALVMGAKMFAGTVWNILGKGDK